MNALVVPDAVPSPGSRLRLEWRRAQPAMARSWPLLAGLGAALAVALLWWTLRSPDLRPVYPGLADSDKAAVAEALRTGGISVVIDGDSGAVEVPASRLAAARILLAGQGLPKAQPGGAALIEALPLGSSRAVEAMQLRVAQERDLAASIATIDAVERVQVHLAVAEPSVFVRDRAAPSAAVVIGLASGRALGDAQVRAIVHLVASSVAGLDPDRVSVVDSRGQLLSGGDAGDSEGGRRLDLEARTASLLRQRVVALLTPLLGADNFSAQVTATLDFAESAATRETYDPNARALTSEQGSSSSETPPPPARGIPGALSNTVPQAAQVSATPPPPVAAPVAPSPTGSSTFTRAWEVGKAVSVTRAAKGDIARLSVAVVIRDRALGAPKGQAAQLATLTGLVRGAVGFDARRGDVVTLAARPFADPAVLPEDAWWRPLMPPAIYAAVALVGLVMLVFGVARPWLRGRARADAAAADAAATMQLPAPNRVDFDAKLMQARLVAVADSGRTAAVVRGMLREPVTF